MHTIFRKFASYGEALAALKAADAGLVTTDKDGVDHFATAGFDPAGARFDVIVTPISTPGVGTVPGPSIPGVPELPPLPAPPTLTGEVQVDVYWQGATAPVIAGGVDMPAAATAFEPPVAPAVPFSADPVFAECKRRIFAVASTNAQVNMAAARAANVMSPDEEAAFLAGLQWIAIMRAECARLIEAEDTTFADDAHWPPCPAEVIALAAKF